MKIKYKNHSIFILFVIVFCFKNLHHAAALHGQKVMAVEANELSFVASLAYNDNNDSPYKNHFCTGTLISEQFVLTAKHCAELLDQQPSVIYLGCPSLLSCRKYHWKSWTSYGTWAIINRHPVDFENDDVAIVKLREKVKGIKSAMLYSTPNGIKAGKKLYAAGWGYLENGSKPNRMRKVSVRVLAEAECKIRTDDFVTPGFFNWTRKICTKSHQKSSFAMLSSGDSGGPLYDDEYRVVGINLGICPAPMRPPEYRVNVHATVMFYRHFISIFYN